MTSGGFITEYSIPTAASFPYGIAVGPDDNIWFTEAAGNKIARVVAPGVFTEFPIPGTNNQPSGIVTAADGKLWFVQNGVNQVGAVSTTWVFDEPISIPNARYLIEITATLNGEIWFSEGDGNRIGRIFGGVPTIYPISPPSGAPRQLLPGLNGTIWFAENGASRIGRLAADTGEITEFPTPTISSGAVWNGYRRRRQSVVHEDDGEQGGATHAERHITEYAIPTPNSYPIGIAVGPDGNIWFAELEGGKIGRFRP